MLEVNSEILEESFTKSREWDSLNRKQSDLMYSSFCAAQSLLMPCVHVTTLVAWEKFIPVGCCCHISLFCSLADVFHYAAGEQLVHCNWRLPARNKLACRR